MYKVLTPSADNVLESVLLNSEEDYLSYIKDMNFIDEEDFKKIMFDKPYSYPVILVTRFRTSFNRYCPHTVYGKYIYPSFFNLNSLNLINNGNN